MCQAKLIRRDGDVDVSDGVGMTFSRAYLVQPASFFCSSLGNVDYDCTSLSLSRNNFSRDIFFSCNNSFTKRQTVQCTTEWCSVYNLKLGIVDFTMPDTWKICEEAGFLICTTV